LATYVVALRRGIQPHRMTPEEQVRKVAGVRVTGSSNPRRIVVEGSPQAADEIVRRFGDNLVVEPLVMHYN
jgi:hypothetical protein